MKANTSRYSPRSSMHSSPNQAQFYPKADSVGGMAALTGQGFEQFGVPESERADLADSLTYKGLKTKLLAHQMRQIDSNLGSGGGVVEEIHADSHECSIDGSVDGVRFGGDISRNQDLQVRKSYDERERRTYQRLSSSHYVSFLDTVNIHVPATKSKLVVEAATNPSGSINSFKQQTLVQVQSVGSQDMTLRQYMAAEALKNQQEKEK